MGERDLSRPPAAPGAADAIDVFIDKVRANTPAPASGRGRLIFALDATMSRQPTWDMALELQSRMFETAAEFGGLDVQLVYFRGFSECRASKFVSGGAGLATVMRGIAVRGGSTQIRKVLSHAGSEAARQPVGALVYVGDAMEEGADDLCARAGALALHGVKAFMFQEGADPAAQRVFREIARLTGGAYSAFDAGAAAQLGRLLRAAAAYAAGGRRGLEIDAGRNGEARLLLGQMR